MLCRVVLYHFVSLILLWQTSYYHNVLPIRIVLNIRIFVESRFHHHLHCNKVDCYVWCTKSITIPPFSSVQIVPLAYPDHLMLYIYLMHCIFYHWESFDIGCRMGWLIQYAIVVVGNKIRFLCIFHMSACLGWIGGVISTNEMYSRIPYILDNNGSVIPIFLWYAMPRSNDRKFDVISVY